MQASDLDTKSPLPLSNLSAAYFEAGNYTASIDAATRSLALCQDEDEALKKKLELRLIQAYIYAREAQSAIELANDSSNEDDELAQLEVVARAVPNNRWDDSGSKSLRQKLTHLLPMFKPQM